MANEKIYKINFNDNVAVAIAPLIKGEAVDGVIVKEKIPFGHKIALCDINKGEDIFKYGASIGKASQNISKGSLVHTHNLQSELSGDNYEYINNGGVVPAENKRFSFLGYRRRNGEWGVRNNIAIVVTVGCVNYVAEKLTEYGRNIIPDGIDDIYKVTHQFGCSQLGDDHENTKKILAGVINNPNNGGVLVVGLGCENNNINIFKKELGVFDNDRIKFLNSQDYDDEIAAGKKMLNDIIGKVRCDKREETDISNLCIGLKCGGSDALSGITANVLIGKACDILTRNGAKIVMTEVPEMFGAETCLYKKCKDRQTYEKTAEMISGFKNYYIENGMPIDENPSPGNKEGGITTLAEKSLGCVEKGGDSQIVDVLSYGERVTEHGLSLLSGPGNDIVAVTGLAAAGADIILFSTGRGTPLGSIVPVIKIASNNAIAEKKKNWIDINAGEILNGAEMTEYLIGRIIETANGKKTRSEINGCSDFAVFKNGVTL